MIPWGTIRPAIRGLIAQVSGLETTWRDQPQGYTSPTVAGFGPTPGACCKLSVSPASPKGRDDLRTEYDDAQPQGEELQDTVSGVRLFTLKLLVEVYDQSDGKTADHFLELIRTRLRFRSSVDTLNTVNVAFVQFFDIQELPEPRDGRIVSIASLEIRLATNNQESDPNRYGFIQTVLVGGTLLGGKDPIDLP